MTTCFNTATRPSRCYRIAPLRNGAGLSDEQTEASSRCMTAFVRDFADALARHLVAAPRERRFDIWLFP